MGGWDRCAQHVSCCTQVHTPVWGFVNITADVLLSHCYCRTAAAAAALYPQLPKTPQTAPLLLLLLLDQVAFQWQQQQWQ